MNGDADLAPPFTLNFSLCIMPLQIRNFSGYEAGTKFAAPISGHLLKEKMMKLFAALVFAFSATTQAQTNLDPQTALFQFNQQSQVLQLEEKEFETIYRTDQVPDTCYRNEVQGTKTECHTEYDRQCDTRLEQSCYYRSYPICHSIPRNVCQTSNQCTTQMDRVCNSSGCRSVPRRVCNPVQHCSTRLDQVCRNEQRYECQTVPRQYCQDIPRQACNQIPNVVKVPYACTRPVQVPIGQQLKLHTIARASLLLENFPETGALSDQLNARLTNGTVSLTSLNQSENTHLYQVVKKTRTEQIISATEKQVNYLFQIRAIPVQLLNRFLESKLSDARLFSDRIEFNASGTLDAPFKGSLLIVQKRRLISDKVIVNRDFGPSALVGRGNLQTIALSQFDGTQLKDARYRVELSLKLDTEKLKADLINAETLSRIADKQVSTAFDAEL